MTNYYIMDDEGNVCPIEDMNAWSIWVEEAENRVLARTEVFEGVEVSTVFLGIDHNFGGPIPILFETMVFGGPLDQCMSRYSTAEHAMEGHEIMVNTVRSSGPAVSEDP